MGEQRKRKRVARAGLDSGDESLGGVARNRGGVVLKDLKGGEFRRGKEKFLFRI